MAHDRLPGSGLGVNVFAVQELQRHPNLGQLMMDGTPVRLGKNALVVAAAREQQGLHLVLGFLPCLIPADVPPLRRVWNGRDASPRCPEQGRNRPTRQPICA